MPRVSIVGPKDSYWPEVALAKAASVPEFISVPSVHVGQSSKWPEVARKLHIGCIHKCQRTKWPEVEVARGRSGQRTKWPEFEVARGTAIG